jgi:hypothetical protein
MRARVEAAHVRERAMEFGIRAPLEPFVALAGAGKLTQMRT